ncbi:alpha/beta fold hydrolase [Nonomuraea sp. B19D2]|uniref:alpha/beta hydrolase n=1 Tax=Nonomuraea sp. B19D2 TaxID=3159561 RepID=UPI0032DB70A0
MTTLTRTALVVVAVLVLLLALLWVCQRRLIYLPDRTAPPPAAVVIPGARDVSFTTADGLRLRAWYVPGTRDVTVLIAGGNAGNRRDRAPLVRALSEHGLGVFLMDYRGYGGNPGAPTEEGLYRDALAARDLVASSRVIYFGESLGAGVVTRLALERPPDGLVLRSPFTDLAAAGQANYPFLPVRPLLRDRFPVAENLAKIRAPVVVVYGARDTIVPPRLSRAVAEAAGGPATTVAVAGADHNDLALLTGPDLLAAVVALADRISH